MMKSQNRTSYGCGLLAILLACPMLSMAQSSQLPWDRMQQQLKKNDGLIAYEIASNFELLGDSAPEIGQYSTRVRQLDQNGIPLRELDSSGKESADAYKMDTLSLSLAAYAANRPEGFVSSPSSIVLLGDENVNGKPALVYEVKGRIGKGNIPVLAKIWIEQTTDAPVKIEGTIEKLPLPGVKNATFLLQYATSESGLVLPSEFQLRYSISMLFKTGQVAFRQTLSDWKPLPAK
ncbi:hypothetical protein SAMN05216319_1637 [Duganella sp. CF402]|uniref:hypothetical protein n=1 Tax=unclassified Duganella TaxID=2636909 RepID=UPI0008CD3DBC|nr:MULTISPECIES: hypothetical protein [unclassified Duganella]RZT09917.1 hypothetical protein EV582_1990 [Duganella sp. BK701]SEL37166.1 hypothetical protein SAMN05216319_1637 [Duganella sp. CF402]